MRKGMFCNKARTLFLAVSFFAPVLVNGQGPTIEVGDARNWKEEKVFLKKKDGEGRSYCGHLHIEGHGATTCAPMSSGWTDFFQQVCSRRRKSRK